MTLAAIQSAARLRDYRSLVLSMGPAAYWMLAETTGTVARNEVGSTLGTYGSSGITLAQSVVGLSGSSRRAPKFTGGNGNSKVDTGATYDIATPTIAGWVKLGTTIGNVCVVASSARDCCGAYRGVELYAGRYAAHRPPALSIWSNASSQTVVDTATGWPTDSEWHFLAGTYDGATMRIYLDGSQLNSKAYVGGIGAPASFNLTLGRMGYGAGNFDGNLSDVMLFDRALAAAEIRALYEAGRRGRTQFGA